MVLRTSSAPNLALTLDGLPPRLPTLPSTIGPLHPSIASIQVPGYDVHRELGRGGMGVVYLARHRRLDRYIALKMVLARQYAGPEDQARFRQEVEAVAKLNHPNIAQVYEVGEHDGFAFAAFEYVDGGTLLQWQKEKPVPVRDAAKLIATIARAVQHAHDNGIIHRDLKPANILISDFGLRTADFKTGSRLDSGPQSTSRNPQTEIVPKITDFGLAKKLDTQSNLTVTGMACGTPNYMAPEQIRGKQAQIGPEADVYGLGAILFELLTAKPPFRGETPLATMQSVLDVPAAEVRTLRADVPQDLNVIVAKCLEKDPLRRYRTAAELAEDLERFLDHRPIQARGVGRIERGGRWVRRNPLATGLLASMALGLAGLVIFTSVLWNRVRTERELRSQLECAIVDSNSARLLANENHLRAEARREEAERAKGEADAARKDAESYARSEVEARKLSEMSTVRAEALLLVATESIDEVLAKFATDPRFHDEDCLDLRTDLLARSVGLYEKLGGNSFNSPEMLHRSVRARYFFGLLSRSLGHTEKGQQAINQSRTIFEELLRQNNRPQWRLEYANMLLGDIDRYRQDGELYRFNSEANLGLIADALREVEALKEQLSEGDAVQLQLSWAKWQSGKVFALRDRPPAEQIKEAFAALTVAEAAWKRLPKDPEAVDLYGECLMQTAKALARGGDPKAEDYFRAADLHYLQAAREWFQPKTNRFTRWNCEFALARQEHGRYLESLGRTKEAEEAFKSTEFILEVMVDRIPDLCNYRVELVEANLENLRRTMKRNPDFDPTRIVDAIDFKLAPYWNLGAPSDRARKVLAESKMLLGKWFEDQHLPIEAGNEYITASNAWLHSFGDENGGFYRSFGQVCRGRAAFQYAIAKQRFYAERALNWLKTEKEPTPGALYNAARAWAVLAQDREADSDLDRDSALDALQQVDDAGFFRGAGNLRHFQNAPEFDAIRNQFTPRNVK